MGAPNRPSLKKEDIDYIKEMRKSKRRFKVKADDMRSIKTLAEKFKVSLTVISWAAKGRYDHHYEGSK